MSAYNLEIECVLPHAPIWKDYAIYHDRGKDKTRASPAVFKGAVFCMQRRVHGSGRKPSVHFDAQLFEALRRRTLIPGYSRDFSEGTEMLFRCAIYIFCTLSCY